MSVRCSVPTISAPRSRPHRLVSINSWTGAIVPGQSEEGGDNRGRVRLQAGDQLRLYKRPGYATRMPRATRTDESDVGQCCSARSAAAAAVVATTTSRGCSNKMMRALRRNDLRYIGREYKSCYDRARHKYVSMLDAARKTK